MIENRAQPKKKNGSKVYFLKEHENSVSAIFVVLSKGAGMINHPQNYKNITKGLVRSNTMEKTKTKFFMGWGVLLAHG